MAHRHALPAIPPPILGEGVPPLRGQSGDDSRCTVGLVGDGPGSRRTLFMFSAFCSVLQVSKATLTTGLRRTEVSPWTLRVLLVHSAASSLPVQPPGAEVAVVGAAWMGGEGGAWYRCHFSPGLSWVSDTDSGGDLSCDKSWALDCRVTVRVSPHCHSQPLGQSWDRAPSTLELFC